MPKVTGPKSKSQLLAITWIMSLREESGLKHKLQVNPLYKKQLELVLSTNDLILIAGKIRSKFGIYCDDLIEIDNCIEWAENLHKKDRDSFDLKISTILASYNMSERWRPAIEYFIIFNKFPTHLLPPPFEIKLLTSNSILNLQLFRSTRLEDIETNWNIIKDFCSLIPPISKVKNKQYRNRAGFLIDNETRQLRFMPAHIPNRKRKSPKQAIALKASKLSNVKTLSQLATEAGLSKYDNSLIGAHKSNLKKKLATIEFD